MTILVTGCAGFIGHHLTKALLKQNYQVIGIDNFDPFYDRKIKEENISSFLYHDNFKFFEVDIREKTQLSKVFQDTTLNMVIHLAAKAGVRPSIEEPQEYVKTNIIGTQNILECMKETRVPRLIYGSSSSVYGNTKQVPFTEDDPCNQPVSPYAYTKKAGEIITWTYHFLYKINVINLRFFTVYGPGQRPDLAIHKFVKQIINEEPIEMYGDGNSSRDYTYIDDVVAGILSAVNYLEKRENVFEIINIGNHYPVKLIDLIQTIEKNLGKKAEIIHKPLHKAEVKITYADITKAKKLLNYSPSTSIEKGIINFIEWYCSKNG